MIVTMLKTIRSCPGGLAADRFNICKFIGLRLILNNIKTGRRRGLDDLDLRGWDGTVCFGCTPVARSDHIDYDNRMSYAHARLDDLQIM
jgi:hypothetical protein